MDSKHDRGGVGFSDAPPDAFAPLVARLLVPVRPAVPVVDPRGSDPAGKQGLWAARDAADRWQTELRRAGRRPWPAPGRARNGRFLPKDLALAVTSPDGEGLDGWSAAQLRRLRAMLTEAAGGAGR